MRKIEEIDFDQRVHEEKGLKFERTLSILMEMVVDKMNEIVEEFNKSNEPKTKIFACDISYDLQKDD
jgi:hypothetical protein